MNAWVIFCNELKILFKDKQALALLFVMPLALIVFLTLAMRDVYQSKVDAHVAKTIASKPQLVQINTA